MSYTTINKSTDHFNTKLYTGNGSTQSITGVGFAGDFFWIKERSVSGNHQILDRVRSSFGKNLITNSDGAEGDVTNYITSVNSDGFDLGANNGINQSGVTNVAWSWKANGTGSSNTDGSITSTVSVNTTAGFSIVKYAGSNSNITVGHGLGVAPKMIIIKNLSSTTSWTVYHESLGNGHRLVLNSAAGQESTNQFSFGTSPTSSVFALGGGYNDVCANGENYIAYCFAEKTGYSKFGSYVGNGSSDGSFCYTGFKPAFVIWKGVSGEAWGMVDNKRDAYNTTTKHLYPNLNNAEASQTAIMDFVSNGFKIRWNDSNINGSGNSYIYLAFAEAPLVGSNNVPCVAR